MVVVRMPEGTGEAMSPDIGGPGHERCGAQARQGEEGKTCGLPAGWGTEHVGVGRCRKHLGNTANHVAAAQRRQAEAAVTTFGLPRDVDPASALLEEVHRTAGAVAWLELQVQALTPSEVVWGKTEERDVTGGEHAGTTTVHKAALNVWVALYQQERKHLVAVSEAAVRCGVAVAMVRLAEQQGAALADALRWFVARRNLTDGEVTAALDDIRHMLRALAAGKTPGELPMSVEGEIA